MLRGRMSIVNCQDGVPVRPGFVLNDSAVAGSFADEAFHKSLQAMSCRNPHPVVQQFFSLVGRKLPVDIQLSHPPHEMMQANSDGHRDVEAFRKTVHRNSHDVRRQLHRVGRDAFLFVSEQQRGRLRNVVRFEFAVCVVRAGHHNLIPIGPQFLDAGSRAVRLTFCIIVTVHRQPLRRSASDVDRDVEAVAVFDDMKILNAETVATSHTGAGVVGVANVLNNDRQMPSSLKDQTLEQIFPMRCQKFRQIRSQLTLELRFVQSRLRNFAESFSSHVSVGAVRGG